MDTSLKLEIVNNCVKNCIVSMLVYSFCILFLAVYAITEEGLFIPLIILIIFEIYQIRSICPSIKTYPKEKLKLLSLISEILFKFLLIFWYIGKLRFIYIGIPLYIARTILAFHRYKHPYGFMICLYIVKSAFRFAFTVTFLCISLQVDNFFNWPWIYIYWPYWLLIFVSLILTSSLIVAVIFLKIFENISIMSPIWFVLLLGGSSISSIAFIVGVSSYLTTDDLVSFVKGCLIIGIYLFLFSFYTLLLKNSLSYWYI